MSLRIRSSTRVIRTDPLRIKGTRELDPKFKPKWVKLTNLISGVAALFLLAILLTSVFGPPWLLTLSIALFVASVLLVSSLKYFPDVLRVLAYWWPPLGASADRLMVWLERDLDGWK